MTVTALQTDGYKLGHRQMFPDKTTFCYTNFTCRSLKHFQQISSDDKVVNFGLQAVVQKLLIDDWNANFFNLPLEEISRIYTRRINNYLGPNNIGVEHIEALHNLGYLPIQIKALPEGARVNARVPLWTIQNTHPEFFWLVNYLETQLSCESWKMPTSASTAYEFRRIFDKYANLTGAPKDFVQFQGHDFSMRGMSGLEDAAASGAAHLLSFVGTDTVPAIDFLEKYYEADSDKEMVGVSVAATEHSVMCMGGKEDEIETFRRLITQVVPTGIISIVSDTWDFWKVVTEYLPFLKDTIMNRPGKVVIRPDSGDPVEILCGTKETGGETPQERGLIQCLYDIFGGTTTPLGYLLLDEHIGSIYGDSINLTRAEEICSRLMKRGFASINWVAGIGSFTYQRSTRDTLGTAMKATFGVVDGEDRVLYKAPKTDSGEKNSAKGLLRVEKEGDDYVLYENQTREQEKQGELKTVFMNGHIVKKWTLNEIRGRLLNGIS